MGSRLSTTSSLDFIGNGGLSKPVHANTAAWANNPDPSKPIQVDSHDFHSGTKHAYIAFMFQPKTGQWLIKSFKLNDEASPLHFPFDTEKIRNLLKKESSKMPQACPWCGSDAVAAEEQVESFGVVYGPSITFLAVTNTCDACGESGDSGKVNDPKFALAKEQSVKASVPSMLDELGKHDCTMAYMERSLDLPTRTIARWKAGETSASAIALLRLVRTYPWLLQVADSGFDPVVARGILVREAGRALLTHLQDRRARRTTA